MPFCPLIKKNYMQQVHNITRISIKKQNNNNRITIRCVADIQSILNVGYFRKDLCSPVNIS